MPVSRWNDDRLDGLDRQVRRIEPVVTDVAVIKAELLGMRRALRENSNVTHELTQQLEKAQMEPLKRWQGFRNSLVIAVAGAAVGGLFVIAGVLLSH